MGEQELQKQIAEDLKAVLEEAKSMGCTEVKCFHHIPLENVAAVIKGLEEITLYKQGVLCLVPTDTYEKQCKELDELRARHTPAKVIPAKYQPSTYGKYYCPNCHAPIWHKGRYCRECGQAHDWQELEKPAAESRHTGNTEQPQWQ